MVRFLIFAAVLVGFAVFLPSGPSPDRLSGVAEIVDGDTFRFGETRIRIFGIDAPEASDPMGPAATAWLTNRLSGRPVSCDQRDTDRYGRIVAVCYADGRDIGSDMVADGWATAFVRFSRDYIDEESSARAARLGIWSGEVVKTSSGLTQECAIKGNISDNGRIYHVPGSRYYDKTRISQARSERWFCSVAEARAAGWRAPRR